LDVRERAILGAVLGPNVATVAFPGGAGTVREAFLPGAGKVVFANRQGYWELTRRFADEMAEVGLMSAAEREALIFVEDPLDAFRGD
jgi:predicted Rossmann-fold nucleotide-binding protein